MIKFTPNACARVRAASMAELTITWGGLDQDVLRFHATSRELVRQVGKPQMDSGNARQTRIVHVQRGCHRR